MFASTYKNTIKTLLRTPTFWMMLMVLFFIVFANNIDGLRSAIGKGTIADYSYHNLINNIPVSTIMVYPMPLFAIVSVVLLLNRDYGDMVYEIEKAYNIKPRCYVWGRMTALLTVNAIIVILLSFFFLHARIIVHGGVDGMSTVAYLCDSFVRHACEHLPVYPQLSYVYWTDLCGRSNLQEWVSRIGRFFSLCNCVLHYTIHASYEMARSVSNIFPLFQSASARIKELFDKCRY